MTGAPDGVTLIRLALSPDDPAPVAVAVDDLVPAFARSIRVALAMKGGVSLAVWIGGAVAELDVLRRVRILRDPDPTGVGTPAAYLVAPDGGDASPRDAQLYARAAEYARLLTAKRYDRVEFDVLAGASAGGLNAVLYGVAQRHGSSFDQVIDTWLDAGAVWKLLHGPRERGYTSVLDGDGYFVGAVDQAIAGLYSKAAATTAHAAERVTVELSATMIDDDVRPEWDFQRGRAHFRFVGERASGAHSSVEVAPAESDRWIPEDHDPTSSARLAYAARTTSSFPGAFEPSRIWSHPTGAPLGQEPDDPTIDLTFAFSHHRGGGSSDSGPGATEPRRPFRTIDGGIADNVPIDRALRAVKDLPATVYVDRAILYLEPDPAEIALVVPATPTAPPPIADRMRVHSSRMIDVVRTALAGRGVRESGDDEVEQVERFQRELFQWQGRKRSFAVTAGAYARDEAIVAYINYRSTSDLNFLTDVLTDPPVWQLGSSLEHRRDRRPFDRDALARLENVMADSYAAELDPEQRASILSGSQALIGATKSAVAWLRDLEDAAFAAHRIDTLDVDGRRLATRRDLSQAMRRAKAARDRQLDRLLDAVPPDGSAEQVVAHWLTPELESTDELAEAWELLQRSVDSLSTLSGLLADLPAQHDIPWVRAIAAMPDFSAADLAPFIATVGIPDPVNAVRFVTINADEAAADEDRFPLLSEAQSAGTAARWLSLSSAAFDYTVGLPHDQQRLDADAKLAGSTLGHFGAFFSETWRRNDWWWGRLDGAAGVVRFLGSLNDEDSPSASRDELAPIAAIVQDAVLRDAVRDAAYAPFDVTERSADEDTVDAGLDPGPDPGPDAIARRMTAGAHTLANLRPAYLVALASRASRVALRAASRGRGWVPTAVMNILLPPVLVNTPFAVAPLRAIASLVLIAAGLGMVSSTKDAGQVAIDDAAGAFHIAVVGTLALAFAVVVVLGIGDWRKIALRRTRIIDLPRFTTSLRHRDALSARWSAGAIAAGTVLLAAAIALALYDQVLFPRFWALAFAGLGLMIAARSRARSFRGPIVWRASAVRWSIVIALAGAALVLSQEIGTVYRATALPWLSAMIGLPPRSLASTIVVATVAFLLALILTCGWLGGARSRPMSQWLAWLAVAVATALAAGGGALVVTYTFAGTFLLAAPAAATLLAWLLGAHVIWWLGGLLSSASDSPDDAPRFSR